MPRVGSGRRSGQGLPARSAVTLIRASSASASGQCLGLGIGRPQRNCRHSDSLAAFSPPPSRGGDRSCNKHRPCVIDVTCLLLWRSDERAQEDVNDDNPNENTLGSGRVDDPGRDRLGRRAGRPSSPSVSESPTPRSAIKACESGRTSTAAGSPWASGSATTDE
jgi:hypothetical protein